ncbi:M16 family metallopeptidase [Sporosarcina sp. G11-34]|uniref:M16 family metallopeptidase n=1 Tax=Sporosarcina sp. G11-34 TaxID=2849605 RepID=UPI0022A976A7|nr:pitrilysin family protein [Sporosarcina sp. G11-34]MCZ2257015.1 insulinase family protein [Sporosarcina sp. G11-34]
MVTKHVCANGVKIVHEKMPHVRSVALGIWIDAGSGDEIESEAGIAHFIEHMLFKGTAKRTAKSIAEEFDRIGGDINAFTSKDTTCFFATVLSEHAEKALTILEDMVFHSKLDAVEMDKEKSVVLEEISTVEDTPDDDVHERLWATMYPNHPIGKPILGNKETIASFTKETIVNFMDRLYKPERIVISVAGNFDDGLIDFISNLFGLVKSNGHLEQRRETVKPEFHSNHSLREKDVEQSHMCIGFPSLSEKDEDLYDLVILDSILGASMSSRLFQEVREEHGLAYSIYSYYSAYASSGSFIIYGGTAPQKTNELYRVIDKIIDSLVSEGVTDREVENAKEQVIGGFLLGLESTEARMFRNGKNELIQIAHKTPEEIVSRIRVVKKENVNKMAIKILTQKRAISIIAPEEAVKSIDFI